MSTIFVKTKTLERLQRLEKEGETSSFSWTLRLEPDETGEIPAVIWGPEFGDLIRWRFYRKKERPLSLGCNLLTPITEISGSWIIKCNGHTLGCCFWDIRHERQLLVGDETVFDIECKITTTPKPFIDTSTLFISLALKQFTNVRIVAEGAEYFADSCVLTARCPKLKSLIRGADSIVCASRNCDEEFVVTEIEGVSEWSTTRCKDAVQAILCFTYTGSCTSKMLADGGVDLLALANFCELADLIRRCEYVLAVFVEPSNAIRLLVESERYGSLYLQAVAITNIIANPEECARGEVSWKEIRAKQENLYRSISMRHRTADLTSQNYPSSSFDEELRIEVFEILRNSEVYDCTVVVGSTNVSCHRSILASRCHVFGSMLFTNICKEKLGSKVFVSDIDENTFEQFLRYLYTGKCFASEGDATCSDWQDLLVVADKYNVTDLMRLCEEELEKLITFESALDLLHLADLHNGNKLMASAMEYMVKNILLYADTESWDDFVKSHSLMSTKLFYYCPPRGEDGIAIT